MTFISDVAAQRNAWKIKVEAEPHLAAFAFPVDYAEEYIAPTCTRQAADGCVQAVTVKVPADGVK